MKNKISKLIIYLIVCGLILSQNLICFGNEISAEEYVEVPSMEENIEEVSMEEDAEEISVEEEVEEISTEENDESTEAEEEDSDLAVAELFEQENGAVEAYELQADTPGNLIGENCTDDFEDFSKVYSYSNISQVTSGSILTNEVYNDGTLWTVGDVSQSAEIVYAVDDTAHISKIRFEFSRMVDVKYPVISVSSDGNEYTDITNRMSTVGGETTAVLKNWTKIMAASRENGAQNIYAAEKSVSGVKFVKIEIQPNSSARPMYLRNCSLEVVPVQEIGESLTNEYENMDYIYSSKNFVQSVVEDLEALNFYDVTSLQLEDVSKPAEVIYKAKSGKALTEIEVGITRWDGIKFPIISYSFDGKTYININQLMPTVALDDAAYGAFWTYTGSAGYEYRLKYRFKQSLPEGTQFVKIALVGGAVARADKFFLRNTIIGVDKAGVVSSDEFSESFESFDFTSANEEITLSNRGFSAESGGKLGYKAVNGKRMKHISVTFEGDADALNLDAFDVNGKTIPFSVAENGELSSGLLSVELPENTKSIELKNSASVLYTAIDIEQETAIGYSWLSTDGKTIFAADDSNAISAKLYVNSQAGEDVPVTAIMVVYDGEVVKQVVSQSVDAKAGKKTELFVEAGPVEAEGKLSAEVNIISDIKGGIAIGNASIYSK